jgi:hypothetical protein
MQYNGLSRYQLVSNNGLIGVLFGDGKENNSFGEYNLM